MKRNLLCMALLVLLLACGGEEDKKEYTPPCQGAECIGGCPFEECEGNCCMSGESCIAGACCKPACEGKTCGEDGCGGVCGQCLDEQECMLGTCVCPWMTCGSGCCDQGQVCLDGACCIPHCAEKECGDDGCGGDCGKCPGGNPCQEGICLCTPDCDDKECGPDGCKGTCGKCACGEACLLGICEYLGCSGKECGDDGCGKSCGKCEDGNFCTDDICSDIGKCSYTAGNEGVACEGEGLCAGVCQNGGCVESAAEFCDGIDNDCDNQIDEDLDGKGIQLAATCGDIFGKGVCQPQNLNTYCVQDPETGAMGMQCDLSAVGAVYVVEEDGLPQYCDGLDNDCDGKTDENIVLATPEALAQAGCLSLGVCAQGTTAVCSNIPKPGTFVCNYTAVPNYGPGFMNMSLGVEVACDGLDNDCDGQVDEDLDVDLGAWAGNDNPKVKSGCLEGDHICKALVTWACEKPGGVPGWVCQDLGPSHFENQEVTCDGLDNDCDGGVDEGLCLPCESCNAPGNCQSNECATTPTGQDQFCSNMQGDCVVPVGNSCQLVPFEAQACQDANQPCMCIGGGQWLCNLDPCQPGTMCINGQCQ